MKTLLALMCVFLIPSNAFAKDAPKSPFYDMYPSQLAPAAEGYFGEWNKVLFKSGLLDAKTARLTAISASAAMKCEYCITAQVALGKVAGANHDEIKTATQIAADVARFSILLYGNEFGQEKLKTVVDKMIKGAAKKAKKAKKSPFFDMYPKALANAAETYFGISNKILFKEGPVASKAARLCAVSASAAMKCEYCISAQAALAKVAGASDDEIKAAIQIAAEVSRFSILLYGNEFGQEKLKTVVDKMIEKSSKK